MVGRDAYYSSSILRARLESKYIPEPMSGCWLWESYVGVTGYGTMHIAPAIKVYAHRLSYALYKGVIPPDCDVDHLCQNRLCINPDHLEAVTHHTNLLRSTKTIVGFFAAQTQCARGHALIEENLVKFTTHKRRKCLECHRLSGIEYRKRQRGEK